MPADRRETGVEARIDLRDIKNGDTLAGQPQMGIQRIAQRVQLPFLGKIGMCNLAHRMHAGIGTSRAANRDLLACQGQDGAFYCALYRGPLS